MNSLVSARNLKNFRTPWCQLGDIELLIRNTAGIYFMNTN